MRPIQSVYERFSKCGRPLVCHWFEVKIRLFETDLNFGRIDAQKLLIQTLDD